jgi:hypothetical protein
MLFALILSVLSVLLYSPAASAMPPTGYRQTAAGTEFTNISTIFLSFFYLFSKSLLNCFLIASNSSGPSSDLAGNSFQLKSNSQTFLNSF